MKVSMESIQHSTEPLMTMKTTEQRLQALEDLEALRTLKARYFFCCDRKDTAGMRAAFADGKVHIDYGMVGTFDNADALVKIFAEIGCHPHMVEMHHGANPQLALVDAQHATGQWSLHYFLINTQAKNITQLAGYYDDEYVKTSAGWKILKTKFNVTSTLVLDIADGMAKVLVAARTPPMPPA